MRVHVLYVRGLVGMQELIVMGHGQAVIQPGNHGGWKGERSSEGGGGGDAVAVYY